MWREQRGKCLVVINRTQGVAQADPATAAGKGRLYDASGVLGNRTNSMNVQRHCFLLGQTWAGEQHEHLAAASITGASLHSLRHLFATPRADQRRWCCPGRGRLVHEQRAFALGAWYP